MAQNKKQADEFGDKVRSSIKSLIPANAWGGDVSVDEKLVEKNFLELKQDIAPYNVNIIAVTKYFGLDALIAGYKAGIRDFAESRALEAIEKIQTLPKEVRENSRFHFIGHLQSNKAEKVVAHFDVIHSVDSMKIAKTISDTACSLNKREKVFLQVNNSGEVQKFGFSKEQLVSDMENILNLGGLEILGLMNMAPLDATEEKLIELFSDIRIFRDELEKKFKIKLPELSMGMSNDYKIAIKEGATAIRIGRKLFK